ncbi:MAG: DMT family transporter [Nitrospirae bacterium]|nr:DMT family transporter [Nitrospirota bacterium]
MIYIVISIILWSSLGIVIRLSGQPVHQLMFFSSLISAAITGALFLKKDLRKQIPRIKGILPLLLLGVISLINTFSFFYAYKTTSIANAVLTHYTAPAFVALLAPVFLKEKLTIKIIAAVIIASIGLCIMFNASVKEFYRLLISGHTETVGIISGLMSGLAYAIALIVIRILALNFNPMVMTFFQNLFVALLLLPVMKFAFSPVFSVQAIWGIAFMGVVHSTIAPILYFKGMKVVSANRAAILGYLEPVCAILLSMIFLGEPLHYRTVIGGALILTSGIIIIRS